MTPANPDALAARISELEAENAQLTVERNEALAMRRWNIDRTCDGEVLVCRGYHDKGEDCDHERFVPEDALAAAEARAAQLQAEVEALKEALTDAEETLRELVRDVPSLDWMQEQEAEGLGPLAAARTALAARAATAREGQADG